jgi:hypothetical protein
VLPFAGASNAVVGGAFDVVGRVIVTSVKVPVDV